MSTGVVIGVGNSFRRDDGVGPAVADEIAGLHLPGVRVIAATGEPGALLDLWSDVTLAIVVDAATGSGTTPGRIRRWTPGDDMPTCAVSSHGMGIPEAYALGDALGRLPARLVVLTVGVADTSLGAGLTPAVAAAVQEAVAAVLAELPVHPTAGCDDA